MPIQEEYDEYFGVILERTFQHQEGVLSSNLSFISLQAIIMQAFLALAADPTTLKTKVQHTIAQLNRLWQLQFQLAVQYRKGNGRAGEMKKLVELPDDEETREQMAEVALPLLRKVFGLLAAMGGGGGGHLVNR